MKKLTLFVSAFLLLCFGACEKQQMPETFPPVRYLYGGNQKDNGFQMWVWIYEDEKIPALVLTGMCRYIDDAYVDTDEAHLTCRFTEDGFTLSDPITGEVMYTATNVDKAGFPSGYHVHVTWTRSPGATWDALAEEKGWQQEMSLQMQIFEGDDIID